MTKLLIPEYPLMVLPKLAEKIGLNEAIVVQQIHYWLITSPTEKNGKKWIYNSYKEWHEQFPFWSVNTIGRIFRKLEDVKLITSKQMAINGYDRTKWYTLNYQNGLLDDTKMVHSTIPKEDSHHITEITSENTTDINDDDIEEYFDNRPEHLVNKGETKKKGSTKESVAKSMEVGQKERLSIQADFSKHLGLTPNWGTKTNQKHYQFFRERYQEGQTAEMFATWWGGDWKGKDGGYPSSLNQVQTLWRQAFMKGKSNAKKSKQELLEERISAEPSDRDKEVVRQLREEGVL